jgi:enoyl-CoA hydratase/carnithine racemase
VRVVVLRGEGRSFSAGLDRAMFSAGGVAGAPGVLSLAREPAARATGRIAAWQRAFDWRSRPALVSIAAVQGHAIGAGFQLALGADIRIVADDAQFTMAEPALGLVPDLGGTKRLVELVGYSRAAEICLTGRRVAAAEALAIGLASKLVALAELEATVEHTVAALLAIDRDAATETKALLLAAAARTQPEQEAAEREAQYRRLRALTGEDAEGDPES